MAELRSAAFAELDDIRTVLEELAESAVAWPLQVHDRHAALSADFVEERITESDVRARFVASGLFAIYEHPEGRREFVGEPVPPSTPEANLSA